METGMIFDIQRCSLDDGPGVRTTVFFKGCPLHCLWCHNPESQCPTPQLSFDYEKCVGCGRCAAVCDCHVVSEGRHTIQWDRCRACGKCCQVCPGDALEIKGRRTTVEEVLQEVRRDMPYFERSGGGVTISGGEPCAQPAFLTQLLAACRQEGIHTALETSGATTKEVLRQLMPVTSLFLWDYKATEQSKYFTGIDVNTVLENLDFVMQQGGRVRLRCPIIPTVGDNLTHLSAIAALSRRYEFDGIDILPYHNMGVYKSKKLGRTPWDADFSNLSAERKQWIADTLVSLGCRGFQIL